MDYIISGIQQVGIGVTDVSAAFMWYNRNFGMDIPIFEEAAAAEENLPPSFDAISELPSSNGEPLRDGGAKRRKKRGSSRR